MSNTSREIRSEVTSDGQLKLSIESVEMPTPKDHEVLLKVEASPINPVSYTHLTLPTTSSV